MNLRQMRAFVSVYEEGSFSAATVRENATQSSLSVQIRNFEELLGVRLFERGPQGVTPTPAGRVCYARCLPIFNAVDSPAEEISAMSGDVYGKLRIVEPKI
ncbi:MAG: LysR family transcriptional regulator [Alphaproteobacteria bacterium]|nr:LysR family transcriptional regulator [Alphaproteobacteria bacterium]